ncbi:RING/FYVE/PHD zinc finger superfamily protein [Abeliophyllum distichum]|uniref:RING/FYVE/PHD zinc finger superfamily protein n=1 Tax=Abeliophyllum distichum TaxID=126358 RepID=A0ABD1RDC9_9LAMI
MSTGETPHMDIEANFCVGSGGSDFRRQRRRRRRRRRRPSMACSSETTTDGSSFRFSDTDSDDNRTRQSSAAAVTDGPREKCSFSKRAKGVRRKKFNCPVNSDSDEIDLECGELELKMQNNLEEKRVIRDCRICLEENVNCNSGRGDEEFNGVLIELGCNCKGDLGAAHKNCADTWFKTKGDTICEICGATALNIVGEQAINVNIANNTASSETSVIISETQSFWRGRRLLNVLLACMVLAFVISWLFHFDILR